MRRQLPARSPLTARAIARAIGDQDDPRARLRVRLAERFGATGVVLYDSGTHALTAAIRTARGRAGNRAVALPGYSCYDVATAAIGADATIVLYDVDPTTLGPDWQSLERAFRAGAGCAVLAPLYGIPIDWNAAQDLAERYDATLVEDAAQGAGATWNGRPVGALGPLSVLSFGRGKGWTGGGGGALLLRRSATAPPDPAERGGGRLRGWTSLAGVVAQWALGRPSLYGVPRALPWLHLGETRFHEPSALAPMSGFSAALVLATERAAIREAEARRRTGRELEHELRQIRSSIELPRAVSHGVAGYLRFPVLSRADRNRLARDLERHGVEPGYPTTLEHLQQVPERLVAEPRLPGAEILSASVLTLPTHGGVGRRDRRAILRRLGRPAG